MLQTVFSALCVPSVSVCPSVLPEGSGTTSAHHPSPPDGPRPDLHRVTPPCVGASVPRTQQTRLPTAPGREVFLWTGVFVCPRGRGTRGKWGYDVSLNCPSEGTKVTVVGLDRKGDNQFVKV